MKRGIALLAVAFQVAVLAYMAGQREWILHFGRQIFLRTMPVDPRDVMRGDYVRLNYEISTAPRSLLRDSVAAALAVTDRGGREIRVYSELRMNEDGLGELVSVSEHPPSQGVFLRGWMGKSWSSRAAIRYGLEAYFVEQGKGYEIESGRNRDGIQIPLEMSVMVGRGGVAVLKDHRWSPLGIGLTMERVKKTLSDGRQIERAIVANIKLLNASDHDLALVDLPGGRSLELIPDLRWDDHSWRWVHEADPPPSPAPEHVVLLKPGQAHVMHVDLESPDWNITNRGHEKGDKVEIKALNEDSLHGISFRFVYRPPDRAACRGLPNADRIWYGRLTSRAFALGRVMD